MDERGPKLSDLKCRHLIRPTGIGGGVGKSFEVGEGGRERREKKKI